MASTASPNPRDASGCKRPAFAILIAVGPAVGAVIACLWRPDVLAALTLIPAWCWLLTGLVATIPAWRMRGRRFACTLTALWIVVSIGWVEDVSSAVRGALAAFYSSTPPIGSQIRVVSLNCDSNERCLADLQRVNPDVVLLQETPGKEALEKMTRQLFGEEGGFVAGGDTAILARGTVKPLFVGRGSHFVAATVELENGRELDCVSLRLAPPPSRLDFWTIGFWTEHCELRDLHRRQLRQVVARLRELPSPSLLIGGDFNSTGLDRALDTLRPQLADAFSASGVGWGATGTNDWPLFRVDQIWTNFRLVPVKTWAAETGFSDHRMVVCDIRVGE